MVQKNKQYKTKLRVGDMVQVISGKNAAGLKRKLAEDENPRDRQPRGKIISIDLEKGRAVVQGLNMVFKHKKPTDPNNPQSGGRIEQEAPIHLSNLMLVDGASDTVTRVGKMVVEGEVDGKKKIRRVRIAKATGNEVVGGK